MTTLTIDSFTKEFQKHHNDICIIHDHKLERLIGVAETSEDFYYITSSLGGKISYSSAVGWCVSLKDSYPAKDYDRLENIFSLNGSGKVDKFIVEEMK